MAHDTRVRSWMVLLALVSGLAMMGCGGSRYMVRSAPPQAIQAPPNQALIVLMRPSNYGGAAVFSLADGQGRFLGQMTGRQYILHTVPPGQHTFVAWGENVDMMHVNAQAGSIYYVLISVRMGVWSARLSISGLTPRRDEWTNLVPWLRGATQMRLDPTQVATDPPNPAEIQSQIQAAQESWNALDAEARAVRTLELEDGLGPPPM